MTDARMPERWLNDRRMTRLSDGAFRAFAVSLMWSVSNRTDGVIEDGDVSLIPHMTPLYAQELILAGLWDLYDNGDGSSGYVILDFDSTQTSKSDLQVLDNARRADREKKRRQREAKRDQHGIPGTVPGDKQGDSTGEEKARRGQGQDRQGEAVDSTTSVADWSPANVTSIYGGEDPELVRAAKDSWQGYGA